MARTRNLAAAAAVLLVLSVAKYARAQDMSSECMTASLTFLATMSEVAAKPECSVLNAGATSGTAPAYTDAEMKAYCDASCMSDMSKALEDLSKLDCGGDANVQDPSGIYK